MVKQDPLFWGDATALTNVIAAGLWILAITASAVGQELGSLTVGKLVKVRVVDEQQQPVLDAHVSVAGIRTKTGGFAYLQLPTKVTDQDGRVNLVVGSNDLIKSGTEITTVEVTISHGEYVELDTQIDYSNAEVLVTLNKGCRIKLRAIEGETGDVIRAGLVVVSGRNRTVDWQFVDDHWISPPLPIETDMVRLVQVTDGQPIRFGHDLILRPNSNHEVTIGDVPLFLGVKVQGQLTGEFSPPVRGGQVAVRAVSRAKSDALPSWEWLDVVDVADDGSFVVPCLPPDSVTGFLVHAPGFVSRNPPDELSSRHRFYHIYYPEDEPFRVAIDMERTSDLKVVVVDENGKPVEDVFAISQINEVFPKELTSSGVEASTRYRLWRKTLEWQMWSRFERRQFILDRDQEVQHRKTNSQGEAIFNNVPAVEKFLVILNRQCYELERAEIALQPGQSHSATLTLRRERRE